MRDLEVGKLMNKNKRKTWVSAQILPPNVGKDILSLNFFICNRAIAVIKEDAAHETSHTWSDAVLYWPS